MRFAITAVDRYLGVFDAFVNAGWVPLKLFTVPARSDQGNQQAVIAYAEKTGARLSCRGSPRPIGGTARARLRGADRRQLRLEGLRLAAVSEDAVNFHASPLPDGRGPYPVVRAILDGREAWGVTCHRLSQDIDRGDVLAREEFPLRPDECHESLDLKIQMAARRLASRVAGQFAELWEQAEPQRGGSYWRKHEAADHVIDFRDPTESILRHVRASVNGSLACSAAVVYRQWAVGGSQPHHHPPGCPVHIFNRSIVVAAADGYIGLLDSERALRASSPEFVDLGRAA